MLIAADEAANIYVYVHKPTLIFCLINFSVQA